MKPGLLSFVVAPLLMGAGGIAGASTVLVQDNFNSLGTSNLNESAPSLNNTGITGLQWVASAGTNAMKGDGAGGLAVFTTTQTAGLDLGAGYFTSNPGIYRLSVSVTYAGTLPATPNSWLAFGFSQGLNVGENMTHNTNNGGPWVFYRGNGAVDGRYNAGTARTIATGLATGVPHNFTIELDTISSAQWSFKVFIDGVQQGTTYTYTGGNPDLRYLTLGSGVSGGTFTGTIDNFTFELVPEPTAALLSGMAGLLFLARRKR